MITYLTAHADWHTIQFSSGLEPSRGPSSTSVTLFVDYPVPGFRTGVAMGPVLFFVEWLSERPADASSDWSDVMEVSVDLDGELVIQGPMDDPAYRHTPDAGTYRLRISGQGRELAYDLAVAEPTERYSLSFWPSKDRTDVVLRATTQDVAAPPGSPMPYGGAVAGPAELR